MKEIRQALDEFKFSCQEVLETYIYQCCTKGQELNALADIMFDDAIKQAKELDIELKQGKHRGFFHGIPISLKDQFKVKNTISTSGCAAFVNRMDFEDGEIVVHFKS